MIQFDTMKHVRIDWDETKKVPLDSLQEFQGQLKNLTKPRYEQLKKAILDLGFSEPVSVWRDPKGKLNLLNGHQRLRTLKLMREEGYDIPKDIPANIITAKDKKEAKRKVLSLASQYGEVTDDGLFEFATEAELTFDELKAAFNFPEVNWDKYEKMHETDPQKDQIEDEVPETPKDPISKLGDLYELGEHRLLCGDSTDKATVEMLMDGAKADMVLTDPPYNVAVNDESEESLKARNRRSDGLKIANDKMSEDDFNSFLLKVFTNYHLHMEDGAPIYVFYADSMTIPFMSKFIEAGFHFAQNCIWNKQQFVMTRKDYHYKHEPVLYGWKLGKAHPWHTDRKQSSVWNFDRPFKNELHPTMKPIELLEYAVHNSSKSGSLVLDLFGGSGSTLIACEKTKRKCFMMELDPHYMDVIVSRWCKYTGQSKIKKNGTEIEWSV